MTACGSPGRCSGGATAPHLLEVWGQRFNVQLEDHVTLFRYRDVPGMIGRVGTHFGEHGDQHRLRRGRDVIRTLPSARGCEAVMVITTDAAVAADGDRRDRGPRRVRGRSRRDLVACAAAPGIACAGGPGIVR